MWHVDSFRCFSNSWNGLAKQGILFQSSTCSVLHLKVSTPLTPLQKQFKLSTSQREKHHQSLSNKTLNVFTRFFQNSILIVDNFFHKDQEYVSEIIVQGRRRFWRQKILHLTGNNTLFKIQHSFSFFLHSHFITLCFLIWKHLKSISNHFDLCVKKKNLLKNISFVGSKSLECRKLRFSTSEINKGHATALKKVQRCNKKRGRRG